MKKYDARLLADAKRAAKLAKEKNKENHIKTTSITPKKLLRASAFQPHVGVTDKVKIRSPLRQESSLDVREALFNAIKNNESKPKRKTAKPIKEKSKSKQALLADIKSGKKPSELKESRILLVNRMLQDAPADVKRGTFFFLYCNILILVLLPSQISHLCVRFLERGDIRADG